MKPTMQALVTTPAELDEWIEREGIRFFKIGVFDVDGVMRGKYVDRGKLRSAVDKGFGFCDVVLGWDLHDVLYEKTQVSGWHTGYRDASVRLDLSTLRRVPWEEDTLLLVGAFEGEYAAVCPRSVLGRTLERAKGMGFDVEAAFEYEFFLFDETPESVQLRPGAKTPSARSSERCWGASTGSRAERSSSARRTSSNRRRSPGRERPSRPGSSTVGRTREAACSRSVASVKTGSRVSSQESQGLASTAARGRRRARSSHRSATSPPACTRSASR